MDEIEYLGPTSTILSYNLFTYCEGNPVNGVDPNGNFDWGKLGAILLRSVAVVAGVALTVTTFGLGSVASTIAITSAITLAAKTTEVAILQTKKSISDGDNFSNAVSDLVDSVFLNSIKIIGMTPLTKTAGFASGFYDQSFTFANSLELIKADGFNVKNLAGSAAYAVKERFSNVGEYLNMPSGVSGYILSYGFSAIEIGHAICSAVTNDYEKRAIQRGYKLY